MKVLGRWRTKSGNDARRGGVIVLALIAVMLVAAFSAAFLELARGVTRRQAHAVNSRQAFYVAEAGLAEAYTGLALARTGNVGTSATPAVFGGGLFWVEATRLDDGLIQLESTGMWGSGRATLGMVVEPFVQSVASQGFFSSNDVRVEPGTLIDSFDSTAGTYEDQVALGVNLDQARLGSNGDVSIGGGSKGTLINGSITYGATGSFTTDGDVTVTGNASPGQAVDLPDVEFPGLVGGSDLTHDGSTPLLIASGERRYGKLDLKGDVVIVGPATLELDELKLHAKVDLRIDSTGGAVHIFIHDKLELDGGSSVTCTQNDPSQVTFQVGEAAGKDKRNVSLASKTSFYGSIYAPRSEMSVSSSFEIFGAAIADRLLLSSSGRFHFDVGGIAADSGLPVSRNWRVVDIPAAVARNGADPFRALGVDPLDCAIPADAHEDQVLKVTYMDSANQEWSYEGMESEFDWTNVTQVLQASRDGVVFRPPSEWSGQATSETNTESSEADGDPGGLAADEQALMDAANDSCISSNELKIMYQDMAPVGSPLLMAALNRDPPMLSHHLKNVLQFSGPGSDDYPMGLGTGPLEDVVLHGALNSPLSSRDLKSIYLQNSPLSDPLLDAIVNSGALMPNDLNSVLGAQ